MKKLDLYIAGVVFIGVLVAIFAIAAVDWLGDLFYHVGKMSAGDQFVHVVIFTLLDIPHKLFEFLPSALLIGALLSLGQLASSSELVAATASGFSRIRIAIVSCLVGLLLTVLVVLFAEMYGPTSDRIAAKYKQQDVTHGVLFASDESYWMRDRNQFLRVGRAISADLLGDITIFNFDEQKSISWIGRADSAIRGELHWELNNFRRSKFSADKITTEAIASFATPDLFTSNSLQTVASDPFKLTLRRLREYIAYLEENHLDNISYQVAFFKKLAVPFTGMAMLMLALPLVFRPVQLGGIGQRLFIGIVAALLIYVIIEAVSSGAVVYRISPIIAAFIPAVSIFALSILAFRFTR